MTTKIDHFDARILEELQKDASQSQRELSQKVALSQNACWRRIRRMEENGTIRGKTVVIDREKVGADMVVFTMIRTCHHSEDWLKHFHRHVTSIPEVIDFYRIGGDYDYMLKIICGGMTDYDRVYRRLIERIDLETVTSLFAMEAILEQQPIKVSAE